MATPPDLDKEAVEYAAKVIATNYIWHADVDDEPGRRDQVALIIAGTVMHAYLTASMNTGREEHLNWCKERALQLVDEGDLGGAVGSMISDLGKHPSTERSAIPELGMVGLLAAGAGDTREVRRWIEGFA